MINIGLTGPTGAGKSTVAAALAAAGYPVIDADIAARAVTAPDSPLLPRLAAAFGTDILLPDGSLDRAALAARAFSDPMNTATLNAITHPAILAYIDKALSDAAAAGHPAAVVDAPLLFEAGIDTICDYTIAVLAPAEQRLTRIMQRDTLTETAARQRMEAQPDDNFYLARASRIVYNNGDLTALETQTAALLREIDGWCQ